MIAIRQLAGQTLWYGISNILAKFLNYLLTPVLTYLMTDASGVRDYGDYSILYSWIALANIIFTYGFETGYFRFSSKKGIDRESLFQTTFGSLLISSSVFILVLSLFQGPIKNFMEFDGNSKYIIWCLLLIGLDAMCSIPFAKLRQENRPKKYAFVKISGVIINIFFTVYFLVLLPEYSVNHIDTPLSQWFLNNDRVGFLIIANTLQNLFVFIILFSEWRGFRFKIDIKLWKQLFRYSAPMIFIGLAGMINEVIDRQMLAKLLPSESTAKSVVGIYSANYKLAIFITLFIQAFKMAAEPFFFNKSKENNARLIYSIVMKWFVITLSVAFLFSSLYLDLWKYMVSEPYRSGLGIVPILLFANLCFGIYYNLSVWYKLTDHMRMGLYITVFGSLITLTGNYLFIPYWGMYAAAWTTLICYASMLVITYLFGQRYYFIPYPVKRILIYLLVMLIFFFLKKILDTWSYTWTTEMQLMLRISMATILMVLYVLFILYTERNELKTIPLVRNLFRRQIDL